MYSLSYTANHVTGVPQKSLLTKCTCSRRPELFARQPLINFFMLPFIFHAHTLNLQFLLDFRGITKASIYTWYLLRFCNVFSTTQSLGCMIQSYFCLPKSEFLLFTRSMESTCVFRLTISFKHKLRPS